MECEFSMNKLRQRGFTLIEILVVVAIIALLISILLPAMSRARAQARSVACASQIGQIARGENLYSTTYREWIPGSPLSTGYYWIKTNQASAPDTSWNPNQPGFSRHVVEWFDFANPIRAQMLGSKVLPGIGVSMRQARKNLFDAATNDLFACPANSLVSVPVNSSGQPANSGAPADRYKTLRATSYLTMQSIMKVRKLTVNFGSPCMVQQEGCVDDEILPPSGYVPRHSRLGREAMKVFIADGTRFFNGTGTDAPISAVDYNVDCSATKGVFTATPPSTQNKTTNAGREYTTGRKASYRHGDNNKINAGFFDGHVEALTVDVSRKTATGGFRGNAVEPRFYYPSGSTIVDPTDLHRSDMQAGLTLP